MNSKQNEIARKNSFPRLDSLFEDSFFFPYSIFKEYGKSTKQSTGFPVYDIVHHDNETILNFALAGYTVEQLSVTVENTKLIISAERDENAEEGLRIASRSFKSSFEAKGFDLSNVSVSFVNGILKIIIPKMPQKKIEIKKIDILTE